jgi:hypothetical protein
MNDDQMDELLIHGVRDYNAPEGGIPREEMWRRIQAARAEARRAPVAPVVAMEGRRSRWLAPSLGAAAAAILVVGIAIGRYYDRRHSSSAPVVASVGPATHPDSTAVNASDSSSAEVIHKLHDATRTTDAEVRALASAAPSQPAAGARSPALPSSGVNPGVGEPATESLAYRLVVLQHLAGSEAMITSFRSSARKGQTDAELARWSRELLSTTRLLVSSLASNDPVMKRLLDDLDLVISQIVQYTSKGTTNPEELDLIEQSINKRGVMSKLRSTIPSRNLPAGS